MIIIGTRIKSLVGWNFIAKVTKIIPKGKHGKSYYFTLLGDIECGKNIVGGGAKDEVIGVFTESAIKKEKLDGFKVLKGRK